MRRKLPYVSIIIVNYNGRRLLANCLEALSKLTYPQKNFEVIVVDNNSTDDSVTFIRKHFPRVVLIESSTNTGFAQGNNLGFSKAKGEYIALLNSDVFVEPEWLNELLKVMDDPQVGIACSKLFFTVPYVQVELQSRVVLRSDVVNSIDFSPIGLLVEDIVAQHAEVTPLIWYHRGFYQKKEGDVTTRWTRGDATIFLPIAHDTETFSFTLHGYQTAEPITCPITIKLDEDVLVEDTLQPNQVVQHTITIDRKKHATHLCNLVQNAGNVVLHSGYGQDRGSVLRIHPTEVVEGYELDSEYFRRPADLLSMCGASSLIRREVYETVGGFNPEYFMYYEDIDFSLKAWKRGWNIRYAPNSIGYHLHKATTGKVETPFFIALVESNHLFLLATHFPFHTFLYEFVQFALRTTYCILKTSVFRFRDNVDRFALWQGRTEARLMAIERLITCLPRLWKDRITNTHTLVRTFNDMRPYLY
jgi:O-antigen biosynthesis protein